jgi:AraC-like DNA-binding protein
MNAFYTPEGEVWKFCWIRFQETAGEPTVARANSPVLSRFDGGPLELAILGMRREFLGNGSAVLIEEWLRLIRTYVQAFASPNPAASELWRLWDEVACQLESPWRVSELASRLHLSEKQFQRVCLRDLGRTPRQHLMWLRMRHAASLLLHTDRKISSIASSVGYRNPFVFASTFKRVMGWTPSDYQRYHRQPRNASSDSPDLPDASAE